MPFCVCFVSAREKHFLYTIIMRMIGVLFHCIFSFRSYHVLKNLGPWRTGFFLFYLLLLAVLAFNIWFTVQLNEKLPAFLRSVPELTFEKGRLTAPTQAVSVAIADTGFNAVFDANAKNPPERQTFMDKRILFFIAENRIYTPGVSGIQSQVLPVQLNAHVTPQLLKTYLPSIKSVLLATAFFGSFFALGLFFLFSFLLAASIVYAWSGWKRRPLPAGIVLRWATFLQGPALILWLVNLLWGVPLFMFALFILFMMYTQQIFNVMPEEKRGKHVA